MIEEKTKVSEKTAKKVEVKTKARKLTQAEFEEKVIELAKEGLTAEKIGENLRKGGIHSKDYSRKISKILKENKIYTNPDLKNTEEKLERLKKHSEKNKQDKRSMRDKDRVFAQLRILKKYITKKEK